MTKPYLAGFVLLAGVFACAQSVAVVSPTKAGLRAIKPGGSGSWWASGTGGTVIRSTDNGASWQTCAIPPNAATLDFRGLWAWSPTEAMIMSSGTGTASRLYRTLDSCSTWQPIFTNPDATGFWDALVFQGDSGNTGFLLGDPVDGRFTIFRTVDRGSHWQRDTSSALASNPSGEGAFAASNSSLAVFPASSSFTFGTGGRGGFRLFRNQNAGPSWRVDSLPVAARSETAGIFAIAFRTAKQGVAVGGDYKNPTAGKDTAFFTTDGGDTWVPAAIPPRGYRSSVAWDGQTGMWVAAGSTGVDLSADGGRSWTAVEDGNWNAISPPWLVGPEGHLARLVLRK